MKKKVQPEVGNVIPDSPVLFPARVRAGGVPLVAKADEIHEITFMAHDFGHFAIPDLTYIGCDSLMHRRAYIAWRMSSEAFTMVSAPVWIEQTSFEN
jgi:hypothetical protein